MLTNSGVGTAPMTKPTNENSNIHQISLQGDLEKLSSILVGESSKIQDLLSEKDEDGKVAIHYTSFSKDNIPSLNLILSIVASKDYLISKDNSGWTALHIAAWQNNVEAIKILIEKGADCDSLDNSNETPLHKASLYGNIESVSLLLSSGANVNSLSSTRDTPLHYAALHGHSKVIHVLLEKGADLSLINSDSLTALEQSCFSGNLESFHCIINKEPSKGPLLIHAAAGGNVDIVNEIIEKYGEKVTETDANGDTPLHYACLYGRSKCVERLIELGCNTETEDSFGEKPLHKAVRSGNVEIVKLLSSSSLDATIPNSAANALHLACIEGLADIAVYLLANGTPINNLDSEGASPLHKAAFHGHVHLCKLLLEKGANIQLKDHAGSTPLHKAAWNGHAQCIITLIECGAQIEAKDNDGGTPLLNAVYNSQPASVRALVSLGANVNTIDNNSRNALHIASVIGSLECIHILLSETSINENARDLRGKTPFLYALQKGNEEIARYLAREGAEIPTKDYETDLTTEQVAERYNIDQTLLESIIKEESPRAEEMDEEQQKLWKTGIQLFNNNSTKKGIAFLRSVNMLGDTPQDVAEFLLNCAELSKKQIGDHLGEEEYVPVLDAFVQLLDFAGLEFDVALRRFLFRFRLPGEAQKIDRIMERFALQYYNNNPTTFSASDTVYLLAFATIMLNTDSHSPQIKKKMTKAEFLNNTKFINNGGPLPREYMENLYDKIVADEIKMETEGKMWSTAEKKGWLTKQGGQIKTWKRRWFILDNNCLYYFKTPQDSEPCGIIPLENLQVTKTETKRRYCFTISDPTGDAVKSARIASDGSVVKGNHQAFYVAASSQEEMDSWYNAINSNIHRNPFYDLLKKQTQRPAKN